LVSRCVSYGRSTHGSAIRTIQGFTILSKGNRAEVKRGALATARESIKRRVVSWGGVKHEGQHDGHEHQGKDAKSVNLFKGWHNKYPTCNFLSNVNSFPRIA
jgi:hypothetical protein